MTAEKNSAQTNKQTNRQTNQQTLRKQWSLGREPTRQSQTADFAPGVQFVTTVYHDKVKHHGDSYSEYVGIFDYLLQHGAHRYCQRIMGKNVIH